MNAVVLSSAVGGVSVLIGAVMNHFFASKRGRKSRIDKKFDRIDKRFDRIEEMFKELSDRITALDAKFTGRIGDLEAKVTGEIKSLEIRLTDKFIGHLTDLRKEVHEGFKAHGERLARIETKLEIDHTAEAA